MPSRRNLFAIALTTWLLALLAGAPAAAQSNEPGMKFTATAVNMSGVGRTGTSQVDIVIDRWSSEAERERLTRTFLEQGPEKLLDALQDTRPVGYIRTPESLGWDLRFATRIPDEEGGARIIIVTDRRMSFREAATRPRSADYPFTLIELRVDKEGNGEGRASVATKITLNKRTNVVELEDFATQPVMLKNIRRR